MSCTKSRRVNASAILSRCGSSLKTPPFAKSLLCGTWRYVCRGPTSSSTSMKSSMVASSCLQSQEANRNLTQSKASTFSILVTALIQNDAQKQIPIQLVLAARLHYNINVEHLVPSVLLSRYVVVPSLLLILSRNAISNCAKRLAQNGVTNFRTEPQQRSQLQAPISHFPTFSNISHLGKRKIISFCFWCLEGTP